MISIEPEARAQSAVSGPVPRKLSILLVSVLLFVATIHCAACVFWVNYSYIDLKAYAAGTGVMPYQGRIGMMPLLRFAENTPSFNSLAKKIDNNRHLRHGRYTFETIGPEKLASVAAGVVSLLLSVAIALIYGLKRFPSMWWLPPVLLLAMLYVTEGARYEVTLWYPYDLPHGLLFGSACLLILEGAWVPVMLLFLIDLPVRETAIFLAAVSLTVGWARNERKQALAAAAAMLAVWVGFRIYILRRFAANNASEMGLHIADNFHNVINPTHWPQIMSAFGFLLIFLGLGNRLLSRSQRAFLLGALPCLLVTLGYGVWEETRIFGEWLLPAAVLMTAELAQRYRLVEQPALLDRKA